jgi:type III secretion system low calcium response chaperone LcrH/SycD
LFKKQESSVIGEEENIYSLAYGSYASGNFSQASALFTSLALTNPLEERYWRGLASSKQMETRYEEALKAWSVTALLDSSDPLPHFHAAECLTSLKDKEEALKALTMAESLVNGATELQEKIQVLKMINSEKNDA